MEQMHGCFLLHVNLTHDKAKRRPSSFQNQFFNNQFQRTPASLLTKENILSRNEHNFLDGRQEESCVPCEPIRNFLETRTSYNHQEKLAEVDASHGSSVCIVDYGDGITASTTKGSVAKTVETICTDRSGEEVEGSGTGMSFLDKYIVPLSLIGRWGSAMYIVYPDSKRCCCFSKSYYRYVNGTGSFLATSEIFKFGSTQSPEVQYLKDLRLRYFTPREVANLHSFPEDFQFPQHISIRQHFSHAGPTSRVQAGFVFLAAHLLLKI